MKVAILTTDNREAHRRYDMPHPYFGTAPEGLLEGFAMLSGSADPLEVHVISCTQRPVIAPEKIAPNIWYHSLVVPKLGWLRTGHQGCIRAVGRKLRDIHPDLVHAQGTERDCALSAIFTPYPKILTIHGNLRLIHRQVGFPLFSAMWFQTYLEGWSVPRFDGVVCITNYTRQAVKAEVPRTWVVPNAVDSTFIKLGKERLLDQGWMSSGPEDKTPVILVIGTVDERKNQIGLIHALDSLALKLRFQVRFFGSGGDGDYAREFRRLVAGRSWCLYGGSIGRTELRHEFAGADLLVLPTHEDNCPMVVLEAMAAGVPVMASKVGGVPDLIDGVTTGLFCDPECPASLRDGVASLLGDRALWSRLQFAAHQEALARFHPEVVARRHLDIYREIAA